MRPPLERLIEADGAGAGGPLVFKGERLEVTL